MGSWRTSSPKQYVPRALQTMTGSIGWAEKANVRRMIGLVPPTWSRCRCEMTTHRYLPKKLRGSRRSKPAPKPVFPCPATVEQENGLGGFAPGRRHPPRLEEPSMGMGARPTAGWTRVRPDRYARAASPRGGTRLVCRSSAEHDRPARPAAAVAPAGATLRSNIIALGARCATTVMHILVP
jgi:hypothetical protein